MKFVSLLFVLILSVACGKNGGGGTSTSAEADNRGSCTLDGRPVACGSITGADGNGVDLLEAMVDVPVKIENADITFLADKSSGTKGRRIDCNVNVKNGEVYRFALRGDKLLLMTTDGSYEMQKTSDGDGILGSWFWKGYVGQGTHVIRQMSVLSTNRIILRTSCEL